MTCAGFRPSVSVPQRSVGLLVTANGQLFHSPAVISRAARVPVRLLRGRSSRREASRTPELVALNDAYLHFVWGNCGYYKGVSLGYGHLTINLALLTFLPSWGRRIHCCNQFDDLLILVLYVCPVKALARQRWRDSGQRWLESVAPCRSKIPPNRHSTTPLVSASQIVSVHLPSESC